MVIYLTQDSGFNFSSLLKVSENIVVVANRDCPLFGDPSDHIDKIKQALKHFDVKNDIFVPAGDPINISIISHILLKKGGELGIKYMKWDRASSVYVPVTIKINDNENKKE